MRQELVDSGRTLDRSDWVERVVQGERHEGGPGRLARQHYWGVTYHTRRILSGWVTRMPYEMTDAVIENIAEEVLGTSRSPATATCTGCSSSPAPSARPTR